MKVIFNPLSNQFEMVTDTKEIRTVVMDVLRDVPLGGGGGGLQDAPSNGSLYGRQDGVWTVVPEGVTDHALLSNLDYASAAHTGFQETLTFPLAANLGGTGIANLAGSTLTLGAATSITGGGIVALGGFTLTVPATGTAALLATANVFTAIQKINVNSTVALLVEQDGVKDNVLVVDTTSGRVGINVIPTLPLQIAGASTSSVVYIAGTSTVNSYAYGNRLDTTVTSATQHAYGWYQNATVAPASGKTGTNFAVQGTISTAAGTVDNVQFLIGNVTKAGAGTLNNNYGLQIFNQTSGANNYAISAGKGLSVLGDQLSISGWQDVNQLIVTGFTTQTLPLAHLIDNTGTTNAIRNVLQLEARSTGTAAAGFGVGLPFLAETATDATYQQQGLISTSWIDATNATRKAKMSLSAYDTAARLGIEIEADGSAAKLGFYGVATVVRPTALTTQLTTITHTAPTPDYAIQDFVDVSLGTGWAFASHDEANTTLSVIANLQTRVSEIETKLQALGLLT
jgi:hypothetical protein